MQNDSLETLAATAPKKFIANVRDANKRIAELEAERDAQIRVVEFLTIQKNAAANTAAPEVAAEKIGRERFAATARIEGQSATPPTQTESSPAKTGLKGRAKFSANVKII
jgi:L,D-peptidoglycan transpeptidase YkuD (ErfK/YbiS/YcfS/YnhG family)